MEFVSWRIPGTIFFAQYLFASLSQGGDCRQELAKRYGAKKSKDTIGSESTPSRAKNGHLARRERANRVRFGLVGGKRAQPTQAVQRRPPDLGIGVRERGDQFGNPIAAAADEGFHCLDASG